MTELQNDQGLLVLETINPFDMTADDLVQLAEEIRQSLRMPIGVAYDDQHGAGVTWHEVLHIWLPSVDFLKDEGWEIVLGIIVENLRRRFRRSGNERRPKTLIIRDPQTENVVAEFIIEEADAEPKEREPDQSPRRRPPVKRRIG